MKQLRVLTGRHAGTQLMLSASMYRIDSSEQADIQLTDWQSEPLVLELQETDSVITVTFTSQAADESQPAARELLADFVPKRFGDVVLCVGPMHAQWPSDVELLELLMRPVVKAVEAVKASPAARRSGRAVAMCVTASLAMAGAFAAVVWRNAEAAKARVVPEALVGQVFRAVTATSLANLSVRPLGDRVVVEGLLASSAEAVALRQVLARFPAERIEHQYAAAPDVAQGISDALALPGVSVSYRGQGNFAVTGRAMHLDKVREAAARIAADLAPLVHGIDVDAVEAPAPDKVPVGAMLSSDGLQYVQTRDGVKHLSLLPDSPQAVVELIDTPASPSR
jgi:type III secretion protein D